VNLLLAVPAALAAMRLLVTERSPGRARLDLPGTVTAVGGLFAVVYGFSHAESAGWTDPVTLGVLAAGAVLLATFAWVEGRVAHPLLPLRVVLDRNRGGSFLAVALTGAGMFGVFLFLTYYLQQTLGFSPIQTGLAFLPMIVGVVAASTLSTTRLLPRTGPKPLVTAGMLLAATGMLLLTGVAVDSGYATTVLPALVVAGLGFGLVLSPSMSTGTLGVDAADAGAASAMINTSQQVGGSLGTALLSTLASSAVASSMAGQRPSSEVLAQAAVHGYTTAFFWSAAIFAVGAVVCGSLLRPGVQAQARLAPDAVPALAH
jgi:predicted MFS family arabinose efflux permease